MDDIISALVHFDNGWSRVILVQVEAIFKIKDKYFKEKNVQGLGLGQIHGLTADERKTIEKVNFME